MKAFSQSIQSLKFSKLLGCLWLVLSLGQFVHADEWPKLAEKTMEMDEFGSVRFYILLTETNEFQFHPPQNAGVGMEASSKKVFISFPDHPVTMTLQISTNYAGGLPKDEVLQGRVLEIYPGGRILQTSSCDSRLGTCRFIDIEQPRPNQLSTTTRHAFVSFAGGSAEVTMSGLTRNFHARPYLFGSLLSSLEAKPRQVKK